MPIDIVLQLQLQALTAELVTLCGIFTYLLSNTHSASLKMSLYKRCSLFFIFTFQPFDGQCLLLVISALHVGA